MPSDDTIRVVHEIADRYGVSRDVADIICAQVKNDTWALARPAVRAATLDDVQRVVDAQSSGPACQVAVRALRAHAGCVVTGEGRVEQVTVSSDPDSTAVDDVTVRDVAMFRAEMLDNTNLWMSCYLDEQADRRVTFHVQATKRRGQRLALEVTMTEDGR